MQSYSDAVNFINSRQSEVYIWLSEYGCQGHSGYSDAANFKNSGQSEVTFDCQSTLSGRIALSGSQGVKCYSDAANVINSGQSEVYIWLSEYGCQVE